MTVDYMSSEHSMSESDGDSPHEDGYESPGVERPKKKVFGVSTLDWRSPELTQLMHSLDRKLTRRRSAKSTNMVMEGGTQALSQAAQLLMMPTPLHWHNWGF